jgi:hypothetical protein
MFSERHTVNRCASVASLVALGLAATGCSGIVSGSNSSPQAPVVTTPPASQTVTAGQTATFTVAATGTAPLSYQWNKNSAAISGATSSNYTTPATTAADNGAQFTVLVSNSAGTATSPAAMLTVNAAAPQLHITTTQLPGGFLSGSYTGALTASGGSSPYTWSLQSGALPNGLTLNAGGTISGTPTLAGSFSFTVQVSDTAAHSASANLSINIVTPMPTVAISSPTSGASLSGAVNVSGTASDTVSLTSVEVSVDNGTFSSASGTNNWSFNLNTNSLTNGAHTLTAQATDAAGITATSSPLAITVNNGTLAADCTLFASASGNDGNSGSSPSSPKTFTGAAAATQPGSVVCLLGGTYSFSSAFSPPNSGTPSSWIVYQAYGDSPVYINYTGAPTGDSMFSFQGGSFPSNPSYLEFRDLNLNGQGNALDGFICNGSHHLRFIGNSVSNTGGSGISTVRCDYITADHNVINHNGYIPAGAQNVSWWSWTSGISYNTSLWFDNYSGIHNIISNNIVAGEFDDTSNHTDGNGIILDLGGNTPPALIVNNVVYGNGGRCIEPNYVQNFWVIHNTCYKNNLDPNEVNFPSIGFNGASNGYVVNNISDSWNSGYPAYGEYNSSSNISFFADLMYGAGYNFSYSDPSQFISANPMFVNAPSLTQGGYSSALPASQLGNGLEVLAGSPAYNQGVDPAAISGQSSVIVIDLKKYIYTDINGKARPQGGADLGAYQH